MTGIFRDTATIGGTLRMVVAALTAAGAMVGCDTTSPTAPASTPVTTQGQLATSASTAVLAPVFSVSPDWPAASAVITGVLPRSSWRTVRQDSRILSRVRVDGLTPGHVYNVHFVYFNHPEHCTHGSPAYSPPARCGAFGPTDPRDGAIPDTAFSVVNYPGVLVGPSRAIVFVHNLGEDPPSEVVTGPGLTNPGGAQVFVNVVDKGPELAAGPARDLQYETIRGGCAGPPFFGPYPCVFVANSLLRDVPEQ